MGREAPLVDPRLWKLGSAHREWPVLPTGHAALDQRLPGGGWPQDAMTEVFPRHYGAGEISLFLPALARAADRPVIWVAPPYEPYAPALVRAGIALSRITLARVTQPAEVAWTIEQCLQLQTRLIILAWLQMASIRTLRRIQLGAEKQHAWVILFRPSAALADRSPAALRLALQPVDGCLRLEILKCRGGRPCTVDLDSRTG